MKKLCSFMLILGWSVFVVGCTHSSNSSYLLKAFAHPKPDHHRFSVCHGYSCRLKTSVRLESSEWEKAKSYLTQSSSPKEERKKISKSIAYLEKVIGKKAGTDIDEAKSVPFQFDPKQQDCIDETVNTTTYLKMLEKEKLFQWHRVSQPRRRGFFYDGAWPHNTAVIQEKKSNKEYTVDTWFHQNGEPPEIVPIEKWVKGYDPHKVNQ